ncbi:hypothetical protein ACFC09_18960 [Streptomyces sp. NPDC056161]|uniref:hypothetical protein n=1 Tax=Streptomyces sp. NPDC056161 TaxID=3345732 RepID=UPI0035D84310
MSSRTQHGRRAAWRTTRVAALCSALTVLLTALLMCLGSAAHAAGPRAAAPMTAVSAVQTPSYHPTGHRPVTVAHPGDCPADDVCCAQDTHGIRAVLRATAQPVPTVLPRIPSLPSPATRGCHLGLTPTRGAPDLHVLQVQRT